MEKTLLPYQHLKIQLEQITSATNNFDDQNNCIGIGGFGKVYRGEVSHYGGRSIVAIKRLDPRGGQGIPEFLKEITMLSIYKHENLISLLGFCYEGSEMILVYEHASHGSLDRHLDSPHLTWTQRLKICIDAAKGLSYLHDPRETHQRLIHCDMKSGNILLDEQWNAKVADFGLSLMASANEQRSMIVTLAVGTRGYCDPQYAMTNTLTKESDVYSLGVVLFEVLCGGPCITYSPNGDVDKMYVPSWIESYKLKKLNDIIFKNPAIKPLDRRALEILSDIAYQCLEESREDRPKMDEVVTELQTALETQELFESQEFCEWKARLSYYEEITKSARPPLNYRSEVGFLKLLYTGVLLNEGKTYFSLNKNGEHCEMISLADCLDSDISELEYDPWSTKFNSRFAKGVFIAERGEFKTRVKTQLLSLGITYTVNLVFKFGTSEFEPEDKVVRCEAINLQYKLQGETENLTSDLAYERDDGWWTCELYQFTSDHTIVDLEILFDGLSHNYWYIAAEGIEFRPLEKEAVKLDMQPISDSDANWEEKLPIDYEDIMKWSDNSVQWTTKKEAYSIICKGFLIDDGRMWFSLDKNGKKCCMISATEFVKWEKMNLSLPESRFEKVVVCVTRIDTNHRIRSQLVSSQTAYATYLVYKFPEDQDESKHVGRVSVTNKGEKYSPQNNWYIYLSNPQTPVIRPKAGQNTHNPASRPKLKDLPRQRDDGWMEVQIWEFQTVAITEMISLSLLLTCWDNDLSEIIIEGVEFRPI